MFDLLVKVARYDPAEDEDIVAELGDLDETDWGLLLQLAAVHRMIPQLTGLALRQRRLPPTSALTVNYLHRVARVHGRALASGHERILRALDAAGVTVTVMKGALLSRVLYPAPHLRPYGDLDLLVDPDTVPAATEVLKSVGLTQAEVTAGGDELTPLSAERVAGYSAELQHEAEFNRIDESSGALLQVDLHFRLATIFDHLAPDSTALEFADFPVADLPRPLRGLAPADAVCHLCYHSWWDTQSVDNVMALTDLRLYQLADIRLAMLGWGLRCDQVLARAGTLGVADTTHWGLKMAGEVLGELPGAAALDDEVADDMGRRLSDRWVQRRTDEPFGYWPDPSWERIRRPERAAEAPQMFARDYVGWHTRRGDVLQWRERTPGG